MLQEAKREESLVLFVLYYTTVLSKVAIMSTALFEITGSGCLELLDSGLTALSTIAEAKVNIFLTFSGTALRSSDSNDEIAEEKIISFELVGGQCGGEGGEGDRDRACSHCVIDLAPVATRTGLSPVEYSSFSMWKITIKILPAFLSSMLYLSTLTTTSPCCSARWPCPPYTTTLAVRT